MSEFWKNFSRGFKSAGSKVAEGFLGTVTSLPGQFIGQAFDRASMRFQNDLIRGNMAYQAELNQQAVDRQNDYNSPVAVAARARAAGVDPSVLLGGSPGSPGISGASAGASFGSPSGRSSSPQDFFSRAAGGLQLQNMEATRDATRAQEKKDIAEAEYYDSLKTGKDIENHIQDQTKEIQIRIAALKEKGLDLTNQSQAFENSVKEVLHETDMALRQQAILKASAELYQIYNSEQRADDLAASTIKLQAKQLILAQAQADQATASVQEIEARTLTEGARYLATLSESEYYDAMTVLGWKDADLKDIQKEVAEFERDFRKEHAEEDRDFQRSSERWNRAFKGVEALSDAAFAACAVAGTVVTGGYGGVFAAGGGRVPQKYQGKPVNPIGFNR